MIERKFLIFPLLLLVLGWSLPEMHHAGCTQVDPAQNASFSDNRVESTTSI